MSNGYVVTATNIDEYKQACALAYSIRSQMSSAKISMIVPDASSVPEEFTEPFHCVIDFPFSYKTDRRMNDWQLYWATPYTNTIAIDCRTLVKEDHTMLWDYLIDGYDIAFPSKVFNFIGQPIELKNRKVYEDEYHTKTVMSGMFFFKKDNDVCLNYFKMADIAMQHWRDFVKEFYKPVHIPLEYDSDIMHSIVANNAGIDVCILHEDIFSYIDMTSSLVNGELGKWDSWTDRVTVWSSGNAKIKIQNYAITSALFYDDDNFLTDEIFKEEQEYFRYINKNE